ncbi:cupin domain-containing protein [Candidatus Omnitrophota bacterium]
MAKIKNDGSKDKLDSKALSLIDLIGYQDGSVVSRTLINKKVGTVTLFSFGKGEGLSEHTAPFDAMVYVVDGRSKIIIAGKPVTAKKGDLVILPAGKPHSLHAIDKFKMLLVMIRA